MDFKIVVTGTHATLVDETGAVWFNWITVPDGEYRLVRKDSQPDISARREFWAKAWCAVASAVNSMDPETCTRWADRCLKDFDERFTKPE
jgi:hypothetical protein